MEKIMKFPAAGQTLTRGYPGEMIKYTIEKQFSDKELWKLTVNQFRTCLLYTSDAADDQ